MLPLDSSVRVFMVLGHTDMRKAINGFSVMVADHLDLNVFTGNLFVVNRRANMTHLSR